LTATTRRSTVADLKKAHSPNKEELLTRKQSQSETDKPCFIRIETKFPSTSAVSSGESMLVSPPLSHKPEAWKRRHYDTLCSSPADSLIHYVGVKQAHQAAEDNNTLPKHCSKNTEFCRMLPVVRESTSQWWRL
jgi:hypothetical protein